MHGGKIRTVNTFNAASLCMLITGLENKTAGVALKIHGRRVCRLTVCVRDKGEIIDGFTSGESGLLIPLFVVSGAVIVTWSACTLDGAGVA